MNVLRLLRDAPYLASVSALALLLIAASILAFAGGDEGAASTPPATPTPAATAALPTPEATATTAAPSYGDVLADTKRLLDLAAITDALERHHARTGAYPSTGGAQQTVCSKPADAGCVLLASDPRVPVADGDAPYWYESDGESYTLFTALKTQPDVSACPPDVPASLRGGAVGCVPGGAP